MESLIGQTLFGMEKPKKAVPHFQRALKLFGCEQATSPLKMKIATALEHSKYAKLEEKATSEEAILLSSQSLCLFYIFEDCVARGDLIGARYAAVQQSTKSDRANDLLGQIEASTCLLKLAHLSKDAAGVRDHENRAKIKCIVAMQNVRNDQVVRLTRLYWTAFEVHLARDPITEAVESGLAASRMTLAVRGSGVTQVNMLASLANALIYTDRVKDAVDVLDIMHSDSGRGESRCWYFYGCMQIVLTLGVRVALVEDCIAYSEEILSQRTFVKRPQLLFCLACSLCLYYKRVRQEDRFEEWRKVAAKNEPTRYDNFLSAIGFLDLLECKLLLMSKLIGEMRRSLALRRSTQDYRHGVGAMNRSDRRYLERVLVKDFAFAERIVRQLVVLEPRLLILQAYWAGMRDRSTASRHHLQSSIRRASALSNINHMRWATHNHEVWFKEQAAAPLSAAVALDEEDNFDNSQIGGIGATGFRRSIFLGYRKSLSPQIESHDLAEPPIRRSTQLSAWLHERGLSGRNMSVAESTDLQDQWLKSASSSFPFWYIINHIRNETRLLLYFSLPMPHWFAARLF